MKEPRCHWAGPELGWLSPQHLRDCNDPHCAGCRPCGEHHCAFRGRCANHVEADAGIITCPRCIRSVRNDLDQVLDLYAVAATAVDSRPWDQGTLLEQAQDGVDSEAFNLVGPAAAPDQYAEHRRRLGARYEGQGWCDWPRHERFADDDPHHPYAVLGRWDIALRETYGPQTDLFVTVTSASSYLRGLLDGEFPHAREFEEFAADVATCRAHLEGVIHDSRSPEQGAHCPSCIEEHGKGPRLRKHYASHPGLPPGEKCGAKDGSAGEVRECRICDGKEDTWHCPDMADHWWSEEDYRLRVSGDFVAHAEWLTATDMQTRTGVKAGTVRKWAHENDVRKRVAGGRVVYLVEDVETRAAAVACTSGPTP